MTGSHQIGGQDAGYPLASPVGSATGATSAQVTGTSGRTSGPKDAPLRGRVPTAHAGRRVGRRQLAQLPLSDRDWQVLERIADHSFLTTDQVQRFAFADHASDGTALRTARRVLARLKRHGLIASLPRRQGGALGGSAPVTWRLTPAGGRLLAGTPRSTHRSRPPSTRYLLHCLAIADAHLALQEHVSGAASRASHGLNRAGSISIDVQTEPDSWRTFPGIGGVPRTLKPDLWARITGHDEHGTYRDEHFIEVDLGTESIPTLLKKCQAYAEYYRSGAWLTTRTKAGEAINSNEGVMPRVIWLLDDPHRIQQLQRRIKAAIQRGALPAELFVCTDLDGLDHALEQAPD